MSSMEYKELEYGFKGRKKIKEGVDKSAKAVAPTLGAVGMSALIDCGGFDPIEADDGKTVLENLEFKDRFHHMGLRLTRKAVRKVSEEGGDATATTTNLCQAVNNESFNILKNKQENRHKDIALLKQGLDEVVSKLREKAIPVEERDIERIATVSSLDPEIGKIIAEAYQKIGKDGVITVESSPILGYSSEIVKGARFDKGFLTPYFINDVQKNQCVLENPYILLVDRRIALNSQIKNLFEAVIKSGNNNVLVIANSVEGEALASLVMNHRNGTLKVCCVVPPYTMERNREWMKDIALLTGATVVSEEAGMLMENIGMEVLGQAESATITKDRTMIVNGLGTKEAIDERVKALKSLLDNETGDYKRQVLKERIGALTGGIGVIRVGAVTDTDVKAKKYKIQNAINVVAGGLEEGIIAGGGSTLAKIATEIKNPIFKRALTSPLHTMAMNAGMYDSRPFWKFWKKPSAHKAVKAVQNAPKNYGYNFITGKLCNLVEDGVIDSVRNTRLALESATWLATVMARGEVVEYNTETTEEK